jgi:MFS family permease
VPRARLLRASPLIAAQSRMHAQGLTKHDEKEVTWRMLLLDRAVLLLFISIFLFHFANAPILPIVALYVKKLGGSDSLMTATVLTAQTDMVPVALLAGRYCETWGRKAVLGIAFWVLPCESFPIRL